MNTESAETYLRCHRPGARGEDPLIQKAVKMAGRDEGLKTLLAEQTKFDERFVAEIAAIEVPETLDAKLDAAVPDGSAHERIHWRSALKQPPILAAIFGLLFLAAWGVFYAMNRAQNFPGRENAAHLVEINDTMTGIELEPKAAELGNLEDWFFSKYGFEHFYVPPALAGFKTVGCRVFRQDNSPVAQIAVEKNSMFCYMFGAGDLGVKIEPDDKWHTFVNEDWAIAVQQHEGDCFMMAFRGTRADMEDFLKGLKTEH